METKKTRTGTSVSSRTLRTDIPKTRTGMNASLKALRIDIATATMMMMKMSITRTVPNIATDGKRTI